MAFRRSTVRSRSAPPNRSLGRPTGRSFSFRAKGTFHRADKRQFATAEDHNPTGWMLASGGEDFAGSNPDGRTKCRGSPRACDATASSASSTVERRGISRIKRRYLVALRRHSRKFSRTPLGILFSIVRLHFQSWGFSAQLLVILALAIPACAAAADAESRKPSLLLITLDTTRADHLGCYGHKSAKTPALD